MKLRGLSFNHCCAHCSRQRNEYFDAGHFTGGKINRLNMGSIIHPLILVILFTVTGVAAMVLSTDDVDAGSVTGNHPEPRGDVISELLRIARARKQFSKRQADGHEGTFSITLKTMKSWPSYTEPGTDGEILMKVKFASGENWGPFLYIDGDISANENKRYDIQATYYGTNDPVEEVSVINTSSDAWFPEYIVVNGPGANGRYCCRWYDQCHYTKYWPDHGTVHYYQDCYIAVTSPKDISCELANGITDC